MKARALLLVAVLAGATGITIRTFAEGKSMVQPMTPAADPLPIEGELPSLDGATAWLNSPPLTADGLRGKVVLVDFWTYTCINWRRAQPWVRAWAEKYRDKGRLCGSGCRSTDTRRAPATASTWTARATALPSSSGCIS
jgi:thiol-disulfide isomerase/thioredoxin